MALRPRDASFLQEPKMSRILLTRRTALAALAATALPLPAFAQSGAGVPAAFPKQPITLMLPLAPGGPVDVLGRLLAQEFQVRSGVTAVVENRTGGAGNIGINAVKNAAADGTTLLVIPAGNLTINPMLIPNIGFDVDKDFAPITILATAPNLFLASNQLGVKTIPELIAKAKTQKITYGTPGVGSQLHLAMELFKEKAGIDITHVPYRGTAPALNDLLGGHIDLLASNLPVAMPVVKDGRAQALAMTTAARSPLLPDVPSLKELGFDGIDVTSWYGLLAPKATPQPVLDAIFTVTSEVLKAPALQKALADQGLSLMIETPDVFSERIRREAKVWGALVTERGIKPN